MSQISYEIRFIDKQHEDTGEEINMSEKIRMTCQNLTEIPSVDEIQMRVTKETGLVLQFPFPSTDRQYAELQRIFGDMSEELPNHSIFHSGGTQETTNITLLKVVDEEIILEHNELFLKAIEAYSTMMNELVTRLAEQLNFPPDQITERWIEQVEDSQLHGQVGDDWMYYFHGYECCFKNRNTGQIIDVTLRDYGKPLFIPDPYFFAKFIERTPLEDEISPLLGLDFHDMQQALHVLVKYGYLTDRGDSQ